MNSFSEFLYARRKSLGLTQQNIADCLNVTNKAVSKWEAGDCFPETAQLAPLADILHCTVDELLHGEMKEPQPKAENLSSEGAKDKTDGVIAGPLKVWQGACIAAGVFLVLFGVATLIFFVAMGGGAEEEKNALRGTAVMFLFLSAAVFLFVFAGVSHGVTDRVTAEQKPRAKRFAAGMGISISAILLSITAVFILPSALGAAIMLTLMAVAVAFVVLCGIGISRFHLPDAETNSGTRVEIGDKWSGVIMLTATAAFLLCGFLWNKWHPAWVVFPIGGLLCAIVSEIQNAVRRKDDGGKEERDEEDK